MSIKAALDQWLLSTPRVRDAIGTDVDGNPKLYAVHAPQGIVRPYITVRLLRADHQRHMEGAQGLVRSDFQLSIWGDDPETVERIAEALRLSLDGYHNGRWADHWIDAVFLESHVDDWIEPSEGGDVGVHATHLDFQIWHDEPVPVFA